ncbi:MAG: HNH endonuclease [Chloroflexi bacterium]|nr:HNH endonuclease [Chloroflexota bacterium]
MSDFDKPAHKLFGQQEGRCNGCRYEFPFRNFTEDHVISQSKGHTYHLDNLQLLCGACNSVKGDRTQEYLVARLSERAA